MIQLTRILAPDPETAPSLRTAIPRQELRLFHGWGPRI